MRETYQQRPNHWHKKVPMELQCPGMAIEKAVVEQSDQTESF